MKHTTSENLTIGVQTPEYVPQSDDQTQTLFFDDVIAAVKAAAPEGSTVRAVGYDRADMFLRAGYRVVEGDSDVVVARGGEREFLSARKTTCRRLILAPTQCYPAAASEYYRARDGAFAVISRGQKPFAAVFDPLGADANLASVFGEIVLLDLAAFDTAFGMLLRGEKVDAAMTKAVAALVTKLTAELRSDEKDRTKAARILAEHGKAAARIVEKYPALLHTSGAAQTAEALRMLCAAEDRPTGMRGETEMLLSGYIIEFYAKSLTAKSDEFPPDNSRRIDSVCEYLKTDLLRACVHATPIYPPVKMRLYEYRRDEFRAEQMRLLVELNRRRNAAWPVFKRLYPDDGYGLKTLVDKTDVGLCLALAPDVFAADTALSFLKQTGRLEKYIV